MSFVRITSIALASLATADTAPAPESNTLKIVPVFENKLGSQWLRLPEKQNRQNAVMCPAHAVAPSALGNNRTYAVDLIEQAWVLSGENGTSQLYWIPELKRVIDGDEVIFDASICEVHQAGMERAQLRVARRYSGGVPDVLTMARQTRFPHTTAILDGACHVEGADHWQYWSCPECEAGVRIWDQSHLPICVTIGGAIITPGPKTFPPGTTLSDLLRAIKWNPLKDALDIRTRQVRLYREGKAEIFNDGQFDGDQVRRFLLEHNDTIECAFVFAHEPGAEQGAGQPAAASESKPEGQENPKPESEVRRP
jgi:hypothetical protein